MLIVHGDRMIFLSLADRSRSEFSLHAFVELFSMNRFPFLLITVVLWSIVSPATQAQSNSSQVYPFSWAGVSTYSLDASSFSRPGDSGSADATTGDLSYITRQVENGYFSDLGIEALIVSLDMEVLPAERDMADSSDVGLSMKECALYGNGIRSGIGGSESFSSMVSAAHTKGIRIALSIDAAKWCGDADVSTLARWVKNYYLDGIRFESADKLSQSDVSLMRTRFPRTDLGAVDATAGEISAISSGELPKSDFWIAGVFPDEASSTILAGTGFLDAVTISDWHLDLSVEDSLSTLYQRAVAFSMDHPTTSIQTQTSSAAQRTEDNVRLMDAATRLFLQPGAINLLSGSEGYDAEVVKHWQKLGSFRSRHPAIGGGAHEDLSDDPYMFYRGLSVGAEIDEVVVVLGATGLVRLHVSVVFDDDTVLRDAYTGKVALVSYGQVRVNAHENGIILLEEVR